MTAPIPPYQPGPPPPVGSPGYAVPPGYAAPSKPPLKNVGATRALGAVPIIGWLALIMSGFLTFTTVTANATGGASTYNGFGKWTHQGTGLPLRFGASAMTLGGTYLVLFLLLPVLILAILIIANVARRPLAIINTLLGLVATALALTFVIRPDFTTVTTNSRSSAYIDANYTFAAGPGAYMALVICLLIVGASIAVAVLGGRAKVGPIS